MAQAFQEPVASCVHLRPVALDVEIWCISFVLGMPKPLSLRSHVGANGNQWVAGRMRYARWSRGFRFRFRFDHMDSIWMFIFGFLKVLMHEECQLMIYIRGLRFTRFAQQQWVSIPDTRWVFQFRVIRIHDAPVSRRSDHLGGAGALRFVGFVQGNSMSGLGNAGRDRNGWSWMQSFGNVLAIRA